jgi:hypothetical protein
MLTQGTDTHNIKLDEILQMLLQWQLASTVDNRRHAAGRQYRNCAGSRADISQGIEIGSVCQSPGKQGADHTYSE